MRTRKLLYPAEKVWVDKHKYDEAERLHYEREATLAASAAGACQEVVAVNGFCHEEDPVEEEVKGNLWRAGSRKKQKKRKCSPKRKPLDPKVDFVLAGLLADRVWFDKPLFDRAETAYRKKLAEMLLQEASEGLPAAEQSALVPWSEAEAEVFQGDTRPQRNLAALHCAHGSLMACHHIIHDVWVNKFNFDDAEKLFVEKSQLVALPQTLDLSSTPLHSSSGLTPDEGYVTALPTPSTPAQPADVIVDTGASPNLPDTLIQPVNGKPQVSSLQALISEVWLEKPIYDDAERCFYTNMFDGHPPGKVRLQECGRPESSKRSRKDKKGRSTGKQAAAGKRGNNNISATAPPDSALSPATWYFMHKDSESAWLSKPTYDSAEAQYYISKASKLASKQESAGMPETMLAKPSQPAALASSAPESHAKNMAASFLMHEKIWFDKFKYDDAEKRYYEQKNGPAASPSCHQENGASTILRDIARARENIQKSLAGLKTVLQNPHEAPPARRKKQSGRATSVSSTSAAGPAGDQSELVTRIATLEAENQNLRCVVTDLQLAISRLENRLSLLEKSSTSHHPSPPPPTQHVTPMKKVEPLTHLSRKVELPSASSTRKAESAAAAAADEDDDDIDLFGSDEEEEDQEAARVREERLKQYAEKKSKKPGLIAKSSILLDVKPWDDETDMAKMEECVRSVQMDGLVWGASKLVPVGYGINKLQIQCVVEDDKVGTDILEEEITKFEDYVQSVDIAAFNKI
ncbi:elongation factor 1-delta isoform X1 [Podarcis lilfordi]|uniref:Elongation factor 1-delta n=2 Tax=Podarcis lilfordi TaxID=74358 RepID=A0AA35KJW1_9SAUR|nr:elongation factor 1-delta isoform X1 [Podarcis lilfordi]